MTRFVRVLGLPNVPGSDQVSIEQLSVWLGTPPADPPRFVNISGIVGQTSAHYRSVQQLAADLAAVPITATYSVVMTDGLTGLAGNAVLTLQELSALVSTPELVAAQWWQPGAYADFDVENSRFMVNGVEYASSAAMVAAGAATTVAGGGWNIAAPGGVTQVSIVADGVSSAAATPATLEYLWSMDDGGVSLTDDFAYMGRTTTNNLQSGVTAASVAVATLALSTLGASTAVRTSARYKANAYVASKNGANGTEDTAGAMPTTTRFTIGNRYDGLRPWNGTINRVTILVTREFTKEQCELMSGVGLLRGLVWSWWNKQLAFTQNGKTYLVAYNLRDLRQYSVVMDAVSRKVLDFKALTTTNEIPQDDHSTGAYPGTLLPNGKLCVINGGHDNEAFIRFQISTNDMPGNLGPVIQIPLGYASTASYAQIHLNGTDLFVFCQTRGNSYWYCFKSSDYGQTWPVRHALWSGGDEGGGGQPQHYQFASDNNDGVLTLYTQYHPTNLQNKIRRASFNFNTGVLSSLGAPFGSIYDANPDTALASVTSFELVRTPAAGHSQRLLDVRPDGVNIAIADTADTFVTSNYLLGLDTGTWAFNVVRAGSSFSSVNNPSYVGGMVFARHAHADHLLYTAAITGGNWLLEQQASADGVTFTPTTIVNNAAVKTMRPICPKGATSALAVIVERATTYNDFNDMVVDGYVYPAA